jgi:hypothetical protein
VRTKKNRAEITLKRPSKKSVEVNEKLSAEHIVKLFSEVENFLNDDNNMAMTIDYTSGELSEMKVTFLDMFEERHFLELFKSEWGRGYMMGCFSFAKLLAGEGESEE